MNLQLLKESIEGIDIYVLVMKKAIQAIHTISPNRLIFVDGLDYARKIIVFNNFVNNIPIRAN